MGNANSRKGYFLGKCRDYSFQVGTVPSLKKRFLLLLKSTLARTRSTP